MGTSGAAPPTRRGRGQEYSLAPTNFAMVVGIIANDNVCRLDEIVLMPPDYSCRLQPTYRPRTLLARQLIFRL